MSLISIQIGSYKHHFHQANEEWRAIQSGWQLGTICIWFYISTSRQDELICSFRYCRELLFEKNGKQSGCICESTWEHNISCYRTFSICYHSAPVLSAVEELTETSHSALHFWLFFCDESQVVKCVACQAGIVCYPVCNDATKEEIWCDSTDKMRFDLRGSQLMIWIINVHLWCHLRSLWKVL